MQKINLQSKTVTIDGEIENYWYENVKIGLKKTLFTRIYINLKEFDSGIEYEEQPTKTKFTIEWLELSKNKFADFDGLIISSEKFPEMEASIYLGSAHNWCNIKEIKFKTTQDNSIKIIGKILIDFEREGVAQNEEFKIDCLSKYKDTGV